MVDIKFPRYDEGAVRAIKTLPNRQYIPDTKEWRVPNYLIPQTVKLLRPFFPELADELEENFKEISQEQTNLLAMSRAGEMVDIGGETASIFVENVVKRLSKVLPPDEKLYPFQEIGVAFLEMTDGKAFIGDDMGLGKTIQALAYLALHPEFRPAICFVPGKLRFNWRREIAKWLPNDSIQVIKTGVDVFEKNDIYILSYELAEKHKLNLLDLRAKVIILDECTRISNRKAARTKATLAIAKTVDHVITLSGTPIRNKTAEFFTTLNLLRPELFPNFFQFAKRYCGAWESSFGWNFNGFSNEEELYKLLQLIMIRRMKIDVLKDLPPKRRLPITIGLSPKMTKLYRNAENELQGAIKDFKKYQSEVKDRNLTLEYKTYLGKLSSNESATDYKGFVWDTAYSELGRERMLAISKLNLLRQAVGFGKAEQILDLVEPFFESGQKLVIFGWHKAVLDEIMAELIRGGYFAVRADGSTTDKQIEEVVDTFQNDPRCMAFVTSLKEGLNLTAASNTLHMERDWTPADEEQREDRTNRIGQEADSITAWYVVVEGTVDDKMNEIVEYKRGRINKQLDGIGLNKDLNKSIISEVLKVMSL